MIKPVDPNQGRLFSIRSRFIDAVGRDSFYGLLGLRCDELLADVVFQDLYCQDDGRPCKSPGMLFRMLLLQMHDQCSDHETIERSRFDLRWKVALDLDFEEQPCVKSTFQEFRARIHLNAKGDEIFNAILQGAKNVGLLKGNKIKGALDTTPVLGRGAVKDTYNLVADGIRKVGTILADLAQVQPEDWGQQRDIGRFWTASSLKGEANIDWSDEKERRVFLNRLVADAQMVLLEADNRLEILSKLQATQLREACSLLRRLVSQDTESRGPAPPNPSSKKSPDAQQEGSEATNSAHVAVESEDAMQTGDLFGQDIAIKQGVAHDRVISVHDPEMRHGRKSASNRFDGHKLSVCVDVNTGLFLSLDVLYGNAPDNQDALQLVRQAEANSGMKFGKVLADCAYGDGETRSQFKDANIDLSAKVPNPSDPFHKSRFILDLTNRIATCPAGRETRDFDFVSRNGQPVVSFRFSGEDCGDCPHRVLCVKSKKEGVGRTVTLHPQEELLQAARARQAQPEFRADIRDRQVVEHRLARIVRVAGRKSRYFGRAKTRLQYLLAAMVANLTLIGSFLPFLRAYMGTVSGALALRRLPIFCWSSLQMDSQHALGAEYTLRNAA